MKSDRQWEKLRIQFPQINYKIDLASLSKMLIHRASSIVIYLFHWEIACGKKDEKNRIFCYDFKTFLVIFFLWFYFVFSLSKGSIPSHKSISPWPQRKKEESRERSSRWNLCQTVSKRLMCHSEKTIFHQLLVCLWCKFYFKNNKFWRLYD